jgi:hypothetical protein
MRRAAGVLVVAALVAAGSALQAAPVRAYQGHVWVNKDGFSYACLGVTDTYPQRMYDLARAEIAGLGFSPVYSVIGHGFTKQAFLDSVFSDFAVYVHSHGDVYNAYGAAFLQDPPTGCNSYTRDYVSSAQVLAKTKGFVFNLVIMSTCILGAKTHYQTGKANLMPEAFGIAKIQNSTDPEFYLGYVYHTWDSEAFEYEKLFFTYLDTHPGATAASAFTYAKGARKYLAVGSVEPFAPNWFGNPNYSLTPGVP